MSPRRVTLLDVYVMGVSVSGLALLGAVLVGTDVSEAASSALPLPSLLALAALCVITELRPLLVGRKDDGFDEITISSTFSYALVLTGPFALAVLAQGLGVVIDDVRRRKGVQRVLFNLGQYVIALALVRLVFAGLTDQPMLGTALMSPDDLVPALLAAGVFFLANHGTVAVVVSLEAHRSVLSQWVEAARVQLLPNAMLLALGPVVVAAAQFSLLLLPLLLLPILAVYSAAHLALAREREALHDPLTRLPNRSLLIDRLDRTLGDAGRGGAPVTVMLLDLDHFKEINDTLGHTVGDRLLLQVADRLSSAVRPGDTVARLGGDEFAVLAPGLECAQDADALARKVLDGLEEVFEVAGVRLDVRASLGYVLSPDHGRDPQTLLRRADIALYAAKDLRGRAAVYEPEADEHTVERLSLLGELRRGIDRDELVVHYQPKYDVRTNKVIGVEALVRWAHPVRGLLSPAHFIGMAEGTELIEPLTRQVLDQALGQTRRWWDAGFRLTVAVNLSARHLADLDLPAQVAGQLTLHGLPAAALTLEVTESVIMADPSRAGEVLRGLRELGVHIAVDDFGTGYSSLAYLQRLDVDELKIDRSFVSSMGSDDHDAVIVRSTIELGHNLGLRVVAEGVESESVRIALLRLGCDVVQGYHLAPPLPAAELEVRLRQPPPSEVLLPDVPSPI